MTTIVIPLHHGGGKLKDDSELRFALRSIAANFTEDSYQVAIVGRKLPVWVQNVKFIQQTHAGLKTALRMAAEAFPAGFFWFYDDCCILRRITAAEMKVTPCSRGWSKPHTSWARKLDSIRTRLEAEGRKAWDYSRPHGPYWFDKGMIDEAFRDWPGMESKLPFESWILSKRDWPRRHAGYKQYYGPFKGAPGDHQQFLNYNNAGFTPELRDWLRERFPEACPFEKPWPVAISRSDIKGGDRVRAAVIHLPSRPRWEGQCIADLAEVGIDVELFAGVDGHAGEQTVMPINRPAFKKDFKREPLPGEIGCYASHIQFARAYDSTPPLAPEYPGWRLVLEDDAVSAGIDAMTLRQIAALADYNGFDVVMLHTGRENRRGYGELKLTQTTGRDVFTHAYLINDKACREMTTWEMRHPIDHAIVRAKQFRVGVLWGAAKFNQRPPSTADVSIHAERKAAKAGRAISYVAPEKPGFLTPIIHQVWIGLKPLPPRLEAYTATIRRAFPGWDHRLWTEGDMIDLENDAILPHVVRGEGHWGKPGLSTGIRSDVVRLEILRQHGGIYFDTDYEALRPDMTPLFDGVTGFAYSDQRAGLPGIGMLASAGPRHPFVDLYLRRIAAFTKEPRTAGDVITLSGPERLRECLNYWMGRWEGGNIIVRDGQSIRADYPAAGISAFFAAVMHPYWYGTGTWASFDPGQHPNAWAAHHWEASWK